MELDDLKERWRSAEGIPSKEQIRKDLEGRISDIRSSGRGIRRAFVIELSVALLMYLVFFVVVGIMGEKIMAFMYKVIGLVTLGVIPPVYRLFKAQRWINQMDYGKDIRSNMVAFVKYYKKTLVVYQVSFYVVMAAAFVVMFTDRTFLEMPSFAKWITVGYLVAISFATGPYIRFIYGNRTASIEAFLKE